MFIFTRLSILTDLCVHSVYTYLADQGTVPIDDGLGSKHAVYCKKFKSTSFFKCNFV
jgi:hypothetical protein